MERDGEKQPLELFRDEHGEAQYTLVTPPSDTGSQGGQTDGVRGVIPAHTGTTTTNPVWALHSTLQTSSPESQHLPEPLTTGTGVALARPELLAGKVAKVYRR